MLALLLLGSAQVKQLIDRPQNRLPAGLRCAGLLRAAPRCFFLLFVRLSPGVVCWAGGAGRWPSATSHAPMPVGRSGCFPADRQPADPRGPACMDQPGGAAAVCGGVPGAQGWGHAWKGLGPYQARRAGGAAPGSGLGPYQVGRAGGTAPGAQGWEGAWGGLVVDGWTASEQPSSAAPHHLSVEGAAAVAPKPVPHVPSPSWWAPLRVADRRVRCCLALPFPQMSFGPISWLLCGEVFPLKVRQVLTTCAPPTRCLRARARPPRQPRSLNSSKKKKKSCQPAAALPSLPSPMHASLLPLQGPGHRASHPDQLWVQFRGQPAAAHHSRGFWAGR